MSSAYEQLIDKICVLYTKDSSINVNDLFQQGCDELNLEIFTCYKEDIIYIGLYSCQIILNSSIFIASVSGGTKKEAYENTVRKFINLCFTKRNLQFKYPEYIPNSFYLELQESIANIDLCNDLKSKLKDISDKCINFGRMSKVNSINYELLKKKLIETNSGLSLTEKYRFNNETSVVCSIFVNDNLLLQQSEGKDRKEALDNTVAEFFKTYEIFPNENANNIPIVTGDLEGRDILQSLRQKFKEKKASVMGPINFWDIIQDCVKSLSFEMSVKSGVVKINNVQIVDSKEDNEYVGNIMAGRKLVDILSREGQTNSTSFKSGKSNSFTFDSKSKAPSVSHPVKPPILSFPITTKVYTDVEREEKLKSIAIATRDELAKNQSRMHWNVLNRQCLQELFKIEPRYGYTTGAKTCMLAFQGCDIISGEGADKNDAREKASKNLLDKYLSNDECE